MTVLNMQEEDLTIHQQIMGLLSIARFAARMKKKLGEIFYQSEWVVHLDAPLETIKVNYDEGQSMGINLVTEEVLPINKRLTLMNEEPDDPISGTWMMMYNFHEKTKTLFYWHTKMLVINYNMKPYRKAI